MYKHILVPTDGSALARASAQAAVRLAKALGARVTAFFAAPAARPMILKSMREHEELTRKAARSYLAAVEKAARAAGVRCEALSVTNDFPADAIVAAAKERGCDLIFMASHGRGFRKRSFLGSETQKVLSRSPVPVLVHRHH